MTGQQSLTIMNRSVLSSTHICAFCSGPAGRDDVVTPFLADGIRAGHVFIDLTASRDRVLELTASAGSAKADMGDILRAPAETSVSLNVHLVACAGSKAQLIVDGHPDDALLAASTIGNAEQTLHATWTSDGHRHWIRAEVRGPGGDLQLLGNPVYINQETK